MPYTQINMLCELDSPGEYFITENGRLYFMPPTDGRPDESAVVSFHPYAATAINLAHVRFVNLKFQHARLHGVSFNQTDTLTIQNCEISLNGNDGIDLNGTNGWINNNHIHDVGCDGVNIFGASLYCDPDHRR
jgi:hypothetical protein